MICGRNLIMFRAHHPFLQIVLLPTTHARNAMRWLTLGSVLHVRSSYIYEYSLISIDIERVEL